MRSYLCPLPLIALAALSCSPAAPDERANVTDTAAPAPSPSPVPATTMPTAAADDGAAPTPGELKTFGDWTIGCDNTRACQANALVPDTDDRDQYLLLVIKRDGGSDAVAQLSVPLNKAAPAGLMLTVDGTLLAKLSLHSGTATLPLDRARAAMLANGRIVALTTQAGPSIASASLAGLAATLLYMDAQQQRVGTRSALRKPGTGTTPAAPLLPVIAVPPRSNAKPRTLTVADATRLIGSDNAFCDYAIGPVEPEAHRLDAAHSLVLVTHPCGNGAYNLFSSAFVVDERGKAVPASFDAPTGMNPDGGAQDLINAEWNASAHRLTTYAKARGLGDCGSRSAFAWDGRRFRLADQTAMGECRGSVDYIPVWRAATATR